jgi:flagellar protein FlaG
MSKIDANVAVQIADAIRPAQISQERGQQAQQALVPQIQDGSAPTVSASDTRAAAARLKQVVETASGSQLKFDVDDQSGDMLMIVTDQATGEVIRRIPTEEAVRLHERLTQDPGLLLDKLA